MITSLRVPRRCLRSLIKIVRAGSYTGPPEHTSSRLSDYSLVKEHRVGEQHKLPQINLPPANVSVWGGGIISADCSLSTGVTENSVRPVERSQTAVGDGLKPAPCNGSILRGLLTYSTTRIVPCRSSRHRSQCEALEGESDQPDYPASHAACQPCCVTFGRSGIVPLTIRLGAGRVR